MENDEDGYALDGPTVGTSAVVTGPEQVTVQVVVIDPENGWAGSLVVRGPRGTVAASVAHHIDPDGHPLATGNPTPAQSLALAVLKGSEGSIGPLLDAAMLSYQHDPDVAGEREKVRAAVANGYGGNRAVGFVSASERLAPLLDVLRRLGYGAAVDEYLRAPDGLTLLAGEVHRRVAESYGIPSTILDPPRTWFEVRDGETTLTDLPGG